MPVKPIRPARNAATATSLAAFSTLGAVPPASARLARQAQAREGVLVGRLEGELPTAARSIGSHAEATRSG